MGVPDQENSVFERTLLKGKGSHEFYKRNVKATKIKVHFPQDLLDRFSKKIVCCVPMIVLKLQTEDFLKILKIEIFANF